VELSLYKKAQYIDHLVLFEIDNTVEHITACRKDDIDGNSEGSGSR
jgi:hypothetical protein